MYKGEIISLAVAVSWTVCAMFAEVASKRMGALVFNVIRMSMSLLMLMGVMWATLGVPYPLGADGETWMWLSLSGIVGYVLGDYCLFNSYILIGSRYGQILMTLAPPAAALFGWVLLGESMSLTALCGMLLTAAGIATAIYKPKNKTTEPLPLKGILFGIGAGIGQGVGLVLSAKGLQSYAHALQDSHLLTDGVQDVLPFASTAIRAVTGLGGFCIWSLLAGRLSRVKTAIRDKKGMSFALGATLTGPFIGVSLSLMATLYTTTGIAQTIMSLIPILILLPTYIFFHQRITLREVVGSVIAVAGVSLFFI